MFVNIKFSKKNNKKVNEQLGILYFHTKNYKKSLKLLKKLRSSKAYFFLGNIYYIKSLLNKSLSYYKKSISKNKTQYKAYNMIFLIYKKLRKFVKAESILLKGIENNQNISDLYFNLGLLYKDRKKTILSMLAFEKALSLKTKHLEAAKQLYYIYMKYKKIEKALSLARKVLSNYPNDPVTHYNIGLIYKKKQNYPLSIFHFRIFINFSKNKKLNKQVKKEIILLLKKLKI